MIDVHAHTSNKQTFLGVGCDTMDESADGCVHIRLSREPVLSNECTRPLSINTNVIQERLLSEIIYYTLEAIKAHVHDSVKGQYVFNGCSQVEGTQP